MKLKMNTVGELQNLYQRRALYLWGSSIGDCTNKQTKLSKYFYFHSSISFCSKSWAGKVIIELLPCTDGDADSQYSSDTKMFQDASVLIYLTMGRASVGGSTI